MAKPRKPRPEEQRQEDTSVAIVRHQKLCLSIDMQRKRIHGHTELRVLVPESGRVGLHADNMTIESVYVDGEPTEFDFFPHFQLVEDEKRWSTVSSPDSAATAAGSLYISSLDKEMAPNLLILCRKSTNVASEQPVQAIAGADGQTEQENLKSVRIHYWVEKAETGIHFVDNVLHTNNQIRRAHCWFPCMDSSLQRCCYDLEFTVDPNLVAVSNGTLLYQVMSKDDPPRKTFVYSLSVPVTAGWISLAVAPFEIFADRFSSSLSHMCLTPDLSKLRNTVGFFHSAFSYYGDYLSSSFPFGSYNQVFIAPEMVVSPLSLGASMCIFSSQLLFDEKVIDQTIDTWVKLAYALARQWFGVFITAETRNDEWLVDGLAGFLSDSFIKKFLGNNEARYRRYKANFAVCKADVSGATALSSSAPSTDLYGTECLGFYGKIRSWKAVAVLQMLEKQMGPESFRKILQKIVDRAQDKDKSRSLRTLSTKEFRHFANKIGNLERPFLKEFFPRWVGSSGCPILRMGFSYNKRRNMIDLAVLRGCTATIESVIPVPDSSPRVENREADVGWPGMMSIRVHELDGMYDHPSLPMAGESCQLLEIQCHSKLAAKRIQKSKKGSKADGSDDNGEVAPSMDTRSGVESPLHWVRVDPEMEYLAEIHLHQPVQMWINQLERDKDVVAQAQAIAALETLSQHSFSVVNALNNFLNDSKAFWRVRIEAAFALASTTSEVTGWAGLHNLLSFYKNRRYDATIGLPRQNDFHNFPEYFVLEAIPHAVAMIKAADQRSPQEAVEFVLQLLKYNDNHGNPYSDIYWLAALVQSVGELEFGQQSMQLLSSLLKRIDRLLQFDRLMPSYNGILTVSCIHSLTQIAMKFSSCISLDRVFALVKPFRNLKSVSWQIRVEASRALINLELYHNGLDAALSLFMTFLEEEPSFRGQVKLAVHVMRLCQMKDEGNIYVKSPTLVGLLRLLESRNAFNNVFLRHNLFCILQILAQRPPTLYGVSRVQMPTTVDLEMKDDQNIKSASLKLRISSRPLEQSHVDISQNPSLDGLLEMVEPAKEISEAVKENAITVSNGMERRVSVVKIRVKHSTASSRAEEMDNNVMENFRVGPHENELGPSSSASVDAPLRVTKDPTSDSCQNIEVHSSHGYGSFPKDEEVSNELQCTADSRKGDSKEVPILSPTTMSNERETDGLQYPQVEIIPVERLDGDGASVAIEDQNTLQKEVKEKERDKKKKKDKKRKREEKGDDKVHRGDAEYLERKRFKREKKKVKEKERLKEQENMQTGEAKPSSLVNLQCTDMAIESKRSEVVDMKKLERPPDPRVGKGGADVRGEAVEGSSTQNKLRIKFKSRTISNL